MKTKVGAPAWADDPVARFAVAVPSAIALTALFFALGRLEPAARTVPERTPTQTVMLERAAPPPPTPRPTPPPTPPPVARVTPAPVPQRAAPRAAHASGGGHAAPVTHPRVALPQTVAVAGSGGGAGPGSGDGEGAGDAGGSGNGTGGTGSGSVNVDAPCGRDDLEPFLPPDHVGATIYEHVRATVTFPDGHQETEAFPYRFRYPDAASDPWSPQNMPNPNFPALVQPPPPGTDPSRFPEVIQYILNHTRENGTTILQECPRQR